MYDTRIVAHPCEKFAGLRDFHGSSMRRYTTLEMTLKGHLKIFMIITPPKIDNIPLKDNNLDNFWTSMDRVCSVTHNLGDDLGGASQGGRYKSSW